MEKEEESIGRRSARTLSSLFIGRAAGLLLNVATFIVVARLLGPSNYVIYTLALGIYLFIGAVGHFGIGTYFNKHISEYIYKGKPEKINEVLTSGYYIIFLAAFLLAFAGILCSGFIASYFKSQSLMPITVIIASLVLFFSMTYGAVYPALVSFGRGRWTAYTIIYVQAVNLVGSALLIKLGLSYNGALLGMMLSYLVGLLATSYYIGKAMKPYGGFKLVRIGLDHIKKVLYFSLPMAANNLVNNAVSSLAVLILGIFTTSLILGNYGAATKGLNMLQAFYGTMWVVLLPTFSAIVARKRNVQASFNKTIIYSLALIFPIIIYVGVFAKPLIFILITNKYSLAPFYLFLISVGLVISMPALYISSFMVSKGRVISVLKYNTISALVQLISLFMLVPYIKAVGAIISLFFIGGIINDILFILGVKKIFKIRFNILSLLSLLAANTLFALIISLSLLLSNIWEEVVVGFIISIIIYPILVALFKIANKEFINDLSRFTKGIPFIEKLTNYIVSYIRYFVR